MRVGIWFWSLLLVFTHGCEREVRSPSHTVIPFLAGEAPPTKELLAEMSLTEKVGQLFVLQAGPDRAGDVLAATAVGQAGGLLLDNWSPEAFLAVTDSCRRRSRIPLLMATREQVLLNNQFAGTLPFLSTGSMQALGSDSLRTIVDGIFQQQLQDFGINWVMGPDAEALGQAAHLDGKASLVKVDALNGNRVLSTARTLTELPADTTGGGLAPDHPLPDLLWHGVSSLFVDPAMVIGNPGPVQAGWLADRLRRAWGFEGLLISSLAPGQDPLPLLRAGVDLLITPEITAPIDRVRSALEERTLRTALLDEKLHRILRAKYWMREGLAPPVQNTASLPIQASLASVVRHPGPAPVRRPLPDSILISNLAPDRWDYLTYKLYEESVTLVHNHDQLLPFGEISGRGFRLLQYSNRPFSDFQEYFERFANLKTILQPPAADGTLPPVMEQKGSGEVTVILLESPWVNRERDLPFLQSVRALAGRAPVVLVNFGDPANLEPFDTTLTTIQIYERNEVTEATAAQLLFGALQAQGRLPVTVNKYFPVGQSVQTPIWRMKYGRPQDAGIAPERLVGIDAIARTAIEDRATPGCQVVVAKGGKIIYRKAFGWHDYQRKQPVRETDLYDIASITKVAATTLGVMSLYDQGRVNLVERLDEELEMPGASAAMQRLNLRKLMTHQSGLQPHMPTLPYLLFRDRPNAECDSFFCKTELSPYTVQIADHFFFDQRYQDSIWADVWGLEVGNQRRYRYSDVNFVLVQRILEEKSGLPLDQFVDIRIYRRLGLRRTLFRPLDHFPLPAIVPTQQDDRWRRQLVRGYVHDETAAMFGGVAGNAGLFSTADELAVIFQMLLNGGSYGGQQFFDPKTVEVFTSDWYGNGRGLGFDKPSDRYYKAVAKDASPHTFGHTGFTGTCVWADPDHDLVYVFLSNRINPDVRNRALFKNKVRERIHQVVYDALDSYQPTSAPGEPVLKGG